MKIVMFPNVVSVEGIGSKKIEGALWFPDIIYIEKNPPRRPSSLLKLQDCPNIPADEIIISLLQSNRCVAYGGISLEESYNIIYVVGLLKREDQELKGWLLNLGDSNQKIQKFHHIDTLSNPLMKNPFPNHRLFFIGEIKDKILKADVGKKELLALAEFILPFANSKGPPKGIDW